MAELVTESEMVLDEATEEELDEMQVAFDALDNESTGLESALLVLLQNQRSDEVAVKIKEQCIYK